MIWEKTVRTDSRATALADRHYSRTIIGCPQVGGIGCLIILMTPEGDALWITRYQLWPKHGWDAWICALFRNESPHLSSMMISQAEAVTRYLWGEPPKDGFVTFINRDKVRRKRDFGRCYRKVGWSVCGETKGGLLALHHRPEDIPRGQAPLNEMSLYGAVR